MMYRITRPTAIGSNSIREALGCQPTRNLTATDRALKVYKEALGAYKEALASVEKAYEEAIVAAEKVLNAD